MPGGPSRWNATKDLSFVPLRPERVVEVKYEHMEGTRFRHLAHLPIRRKLVSEARSLGEMILYGCPHLPLAEMESPPAVVPRGLIGCRSLLSGGGLKTMPGGTPHPPVSAPMEADSPRQPRSNQCRFATQFLSP